LEVRSVSVGPHGVALTLNDNRVIQLQRAEDLTPLYAHALAQLRAACDLLIVRDREIATLRAATTTTSAAAVLPSLSIPAPLGAQSPDVAAAAPSDD
jgi:hypothetical protein